MLPQPVDRDAGRGSTPFPGESVVAACGAFRAMPLPVGGWPRTPGNSRGIGRSHGTPDCAFVYTRACSNDSSRSQWSAVDMFRKVFAGIFLSGVIALMLSACDADKLSKLKPGSTSADEVRKLMGQPSLEWVDAEGTRVWEYPRMPEGIVNYMVVIGPDDVLREVRQVLTEENFARVRPGMSTDEVRYLLGRPAHERYFSLQRETVWDWKTKVEPGMTWYFNVHFNQHGVVSKTSTNFVPKG
ncbi:MAG TPA: hypothetical protein DHV85_05905 [Candidatus Accumulibacter sp.]|nr:hypothetical protein [Accumulibacter sp.]